MRIGEASKIELRGLPEPSNEFFELLEFSCSTEIKEVLFIVAVE